MVDPAEKFVDEITVQKKRNQTLRCKKSVFRLQKRVSSIICLDSR